MSFAEWLITGWTPVLIALAAGLLTILVGAEWRKRRLLRFLRLTWGAPQEGRLRDLTQIAPWHDHRSATLPVDLVIDDRTAVDLHLDHLLADLDHTTSRLGQQALHHRLRTRLTPAERECFEAQVTRVMSDVPLREEARLVLTPLDDPALWGIWRLTLPGVIPTHPIFDLAPLVPILLLLSIAAVAITPFALLVTLAVMVLAIGLRISLAWRVNTVVASFRQLGRLFTAATALARLPAEEFAPSTARLRHLVADLAGLRWAARWLGRAALTDPLSLLLEYFNLILLLDLNLMRLAERRLHGKAAAMRELIHEVGTIDVVLSVASWRGSRSGWCRPEVTDRDAPVHLVGLRHPLLDDPIPQDLQMGPPAGMLITGSNMSGKSTLLRTVGVAVLMAETLNTAPAQRYVGPSRMVRSCIGRADDLLSGRSYYLTEVERVLALLAATQRDTPHLLLFDELFRGTNTVERIAAGEAVLRALVQPGADGRVPHLVLAATHDGELVELLADAYAPWHYSETLDADGLHFDYQLRPGPATTRNAVALLALHGAPATLVAQAHRRVASLEQRRHPPAVTDG